MSIGFVFNLNLVTEKEDLIRVVLILTRFSNVHLLGFTHYVRNCCFIVGRGGGGVMSVFGLTIFLAVPSSH